MTRPKLLEIDDLSVTFGGGRRWFGRAPDEVRAVRGVSLELAEGETLAIVGESGSGKSTLVRAVVGLVRFDGTIRYRGMDLGGLSKRERRTLAPKIQMVFQNPYSSLDPSMTIEECVAEPLDVHLKASRGDQRAKVHELLELVGLPAALATRFPAHLSGGQRQRVALARAVALDPDILICDEATSSLDVSTQARVLDVIRELIDRLGIACVFVTHDLGVARELAQRVAVLQRGELVEQGTAAQVLAAPQAEYTRRLVAAVPVPDPRRQKARRASQAVPASQGGKEPVKAAGNA